MAQRVVDYNQGYSFALKEHVDKLRLNARKVSKDHLPKIEIMTVKCDYAQFEDGVLLSLPNGHNNIINMLIPFYKFTEMIKKGVYPCRYVVMNSQDVNPNSHLHVPVEVLETIKVVKKGGVSKRTHKRGPYSKPAKTTKLQDIPQQDVAMDLSAPTDILQ